MFPVVIDQKRPRESPLQNNRKISPCRTIRCLGATKPQSVTPKAMTPFRKLYFEDIAAGMTFTTGSITIDSTKIHSFARKFDPHPYHLDHELADMSLFGGLCASGWHVCTLMMRMLSECLNDIGFVMLGNDNVPWLQWRMPVFKNDVLRATVSVADCVADHLGGDTA